MSDRASLQEAYNELYNERKRLGIEWKLLAVRQESLEIEKTLHQQVTEENVTLQEELNALKRKYKEEKASRVASEEQNARNLEEIRQLRTLYDQEKEANASVLQSFEEYQSANKKLQELQQMSSKKIDELEAHASWLTSENQTLIANLEGGHASIESSCSEVQALRSENNECIHKINELIEKCHDLSEESLRLRMEVQKKEKEAEISTELYNALQIQFQDIKESYEYVLQHVENDRGQGILDMEDVHRIGELRIEVFALNQQLHQMTQEKESLTIDLSDRDAKISNLNLDIEKYVATISQLEENVKSLTLAHDAVNEQMQSLAMQGKNKEELNAWHDSMSQKQKHMDESLPDIAIKIENFETQVDELDKIELSDDGKANCYVTDYNLEVDGEDGKYVGFLNSKNLPDGHGIFRVNDEIKYEGEWKDGKQNGKGIYFWHHGDLYYGPWSEGKQHGHGLYLYSDYSFYDGEYNRNQKEGLGSYIEPDGSRYDGEFEGNKRCGKGRYVHSDGRVYIGSYRHDTPHGYGVEKRIDGTVIRDGTWRYGAFVSDDGNDDEDTSKVADENQILQ